VILILQTTSITLQKRRYKLKEAVKKKSKEDVSKKSQAFAR
jgi:hypothetical protein